MPTAAQRRSDEELRRLLDRRSRGNPEYWAFSDGRRDRGALETYQYPAMMVSAMQGDLLQVLCEHRGGTPVVFDPFVGSGTTLAEAMRLGCAFVGCDINPLAVLLSTVKAESCLPVDLDDAARRVLRRVRLDRDGITEQGPWLSKWFRSDVAQILSSLRRGIRAERDAVVRRALWVAVAEIVRTSGNMRIGRPKLETRPGEELSRDIDVAGRFQELVKRVVAQRDAHADVLRSAGLVGKAGYRQRTAVLCGDVRDVTWPKRLAPAEIVLTSPPYGDNHTTMPYGQQSYLSLRWIDVADIDPCSDGSPLLETSKTLDTHSLGGSQRVQPENVSACAVGSESLSTLLARLVDHRDGWTRVAAFFADLDQAFGRVLSCCASDAHFALTLGDRTVAGHHVPTVRIVRELLESRGMRHVTSFDREIRRGKRLAPRNSYASSTIAEETVLVMQRYDQ